MPLLRINRTPPPLQLRIFGAAWAAAAALATIKLRRHGLPDAAWLAEGLGAVVFVMAMAVPPSVRWLYLGLSYASYPIGFVLSYVILALLFYGVIVPIGLAFRAFGYDPLKRKPSRAASYWQARATTVDPKRYLQQS